MASPCVPHTPAERASTRTPPRGRERTTSSDQQVGSPISKKRCEPAPRQLCQMSLPVIEAVASVRAEYTSRESTAAAAPVRWLRRSAAPGATGRLATILAAWHDVAGQLVIQGTELVEAI